MTEESQKKLDPTVSWSAEDEDTVDQIYRQYEQLAGKGEFPDLEELLSEAPDQHKDEVLRELICLDYEYRRQAGQSVEEDFYRYQFSQQSLVVAEAFDRIKDRSVSLGQGPVPQFKAGERPASKHNRGAKRLRKDGSEIGRYKIEDFRTAEPSATSTWLGTLKTTKSPSRFCMTISRKIPA